MNCNQCGKEIDLSKWNHCTGCGGSLHDEKFVILVYKILRSKKTILFTGIFFLALFAYLLFNNYSNNKALTKNKNDIEEFLSAQKKISAEWKSKKEILSLIYLGDMELGELKVASQSFTNIKVELGVDGITEKNIQVFDIKPETRDIKLGAYFSGDGVEKLRKDSLSGKLSIKVFHVINGKDNLILQKEDDIFFNSLKEIVWKKDGVDNTNQVFRLINKDDVAISSLVRKAARHVKKFGGEDETMLGSLGDEDEIKAQVQAIFYAMQQDYSVRYILSPFSYNGPYIQKIKEPSEVLDTKSGICIDLSLVMVAAFENIGLNPVLVFVENHVWPGVEIGQGTGKFFFIESTALTEDPQKAVSIAQENWSALQKKDVTVPYNLVRLVDVRADDVMPIKFK